MDVLEYLQSKSLVLKKAGPNDVHTACFYCSEDPSKRGRLYINVDPAAQIPGLFFCHVCGQRGALPTIMRHFGDAVPKPVEMTESLRQVLADAAAFYASCIPEEAEVWNYLRTDRGLSVDTILDEQLGFSIGSGLFSHLREKGHANADIVATGLCYEDKASARMVEALEGYITIPYWTSGNVVMIRGRAWNWTKESGKPKYKTPRHQDARLYNSDVAWDAEEIVIVEGEFDALILKQNGLSVVGVPGANTWQDNWDGYLAKAKRVYTVFDDDDAGHKGAARLADRFSPRVREVYLPKPADGEAKNDPTEWLVKKGHTIEEFSQLLRSQRSTLLITVDQAWQEHQSVLGQTGLRFGIETLDLAFDPGMLPAQVMVALGKSGTGKTILLLNLFQRILMQAGQEDLKILFVSLEQTAGEWWERAKRIHRFYNLEASDKDALDFWRPRLLITDKNRMSEDELLAVIDDFEYEMGAKPDLVAIDYLGYWAQSFRGERYERVSDAVMSLKAVAKDRRLRIITPHQVSRVVKYGEEPDADAARDAGVIEETADFLLMLWTQDHLLGKAEEEKKGIIKCSVGKSRHGGRGTKVDLQFAPISLTMIPARDPLQERAFNELHYARCSDTWETCVRRHRGELPQGQKAFPVDHERMRRAIERVRPQQQSLRGVK